MSDKPHALDPAINSKLSYREGLMNSVRALDQEIEFLRKEKRMESRDQLKPLASWLHEVFCNYDHTEGCGWGYEVSNGEHSWAVTLMITGLM